MLLTWTRSWCGGRSCWSWGGCRTWLDVYNLYSIGRFELKLDKLLLFFLFRFDLPELEVDSGVEDTVVAEDKVVVVDTAVDMPVELAVVEAVTEHQLVAGHLPA